jgi:membrane protease YdiL (CAAX protease family)
MFVILLEVTCASTEGVYVEMTLETIIAARMNANSCFRSSSPFFSIHATLNKRLMKDSSSPLSLCYFLRLEATICASSLAHALWAAILGLFYGYVVLKSNSLLPAMLVHWLGNTFVYAFTRYIQLNASVTANAIYGVIITMGIVPTMLMILWVRFVVVRWTSGFKPR